MNASVKKMDGVQLSEIVTAVNVSSRGNLLVVLSNHTLVVVSPQGKQIAMHGLQSPARIPFRGVGLVEGALFTITTKSCYGSTEQVEF